MKEADKQAVVAQCKAGRYNLDICEEFNIPKQDAIYKGLLPTPTPKQGVNGCGNGKTGGSNE